jgi:hypothetical protein
MHLEPTVAQDVLLGAYREVLQPSERRSAMILRPRATLLGAVQVHAAAARQRGTESEYSRCNTARYASTLATVRLACARLLTWASGSRATKDVDDS